MFIKIMLQNMEERYTFYDKYITTKLTILVISKALTDHLKDFNATSRCRVVRVKSIKGKKERKEMEIVSELGGRGRRSVPSRFPCI